MAELLELVEFLTEPETQRVLLALAQLVGAVVGLKWTAAGLWYAAVGLRVLVSLTIGRPLRWAYRQVVPPATPEQLQQRTLLHLIEDALATGCTYDAHQGYLVAPPVAVTVAPHTRDILALVVHDRPVTEDVLGWRNWIILSQRVRQCVAAELARQEAEARAAAEEQRRKQREALLAAMATGGTFQPNVLGNKVEQAGKTA